MTDFTTPPNYAAPAATDLSYPTSHLSYPAQPFAGAIIPQPTPIAHGLQMKRRNPVAVWIGLPMITFGIYSLVWYYKIHREMAEFDRRRNVPIVGPLLVMMFLSITVVVPLISFYNCGKRISDAQQAAGLQRSCSGALGVVLTFVCGLGTLYYQVELNKVVDAYPQARTGVDVPLHA